MARIKACPRLPVRIAVTKHPDASVRLRRAYELVVRAAEAAEERAETRPKSGSHQVADKGHDEKDG